MNKIFMVLAAALLAAPAAAAEPYKGLGLDSLEAADLQRFAPPPLAPEVSRRVQAMQDIKTTGMGAISPDGKALHFSWSVTGVTQVWKLDGPMRFPRQMTGGEDPTALQEYSPDGKYVVVSRDRNGEENPGLYWQPAAGGELRAVYHRKGVQAYFQWISGDSRHLYFTANDIKPDQRALYRYGMDTGKTELVFGEPGLWSVADAEEDRFLLRKSLGSKWSEYYELHPASGKLTPVLGQGEKEDYWVAFAPARGEYLVVTDKLSDLKQLYLLKEGKLQLKVSHPAKQISSFDIDAARRRLVVEWLDKAYTRFEVYDPVTFAKIPMPDFGDAENIFVGSISRDGRYMTVGVDKADEPRANYIWDWEKKELTKWMSASSPEIDTSGFARASLEYYPARDGAKIPMFVRRPAGCEKKTCPVVVYFHGGPEGMSAPGFSSYAQLFVDAGFVWAAPNVRGSDGYGRSWGEADNGPRRLDVVADIEDCALFIKKEWARAGVAPKVGITGGSYGGYATLMGMTRFAGAYDAGASSVGISDLYTFLMNTAPYRRILRANEYGDPEKDREALRKLSPITYVNDIKGPLLIIQGANDPRVPVGEAVQMYEAVKAKGLDARLIIFPDEGHSVSKRPNQVLSTGHILGFFEKHLK